MQPTVQKGLAQLDRRNIDLPVGLVAILYAITAAALEQFAGFSLAEYVAQPQAAGAFGVLALGRWYARFSAQVSTPKPAPQTDPDPPDPEPESMIATREPDTVKTGTPEKDAEDAEGDDNRRSAG